MRVKELLELLLSLSVELDGVKQRAQSAPCGEPMLMQGL